ncbi:MAG TPA: serine/threonine-protein kinase [Methylophilus sp.]
MKKNFLSSDWLLALILSLLLLVASASKWLQTLELTTYDWGVQASQRAAGDAIAIIAIDDQSIQNIGRWPWSRQVHAQLIDILKPAKVIGHTVFFLEPQLDPGLAYINQLASTLQASAISETAEGMALQQRIVEAQIQLNTDAQLAASIARNGHVVLAMPFTLGTPQGNPDSPLPGYVSQYAISHAADNAAATPSNFLPTAALGAIPPIEEIAREASAIGHLNQRVDRDGAIRVEPLVLDYYGQYYPSMALQVAARYLNLKPSDLQLKSGRGVQLGKLHIATDNALQMHPFFYSAQDGQPAFSMDSFYDVLTGKISPEKYRNKIVLIGMAATGAGSDRQITPISAHMPPIETLAHTVASILNQDFFTVPPWANTVEFLAWLAVSLYLIIALPRLGASVATLATVCIALVLIISHFVWMMQYGWWLKLTMPLLLLLVGHLLLSSKAYWLAEQGKSRADAESSESSRNLGLMLQSQGQLDMAFDRFKKCKPDDALLEALYNLGLDFERKRQFNKAEAVFAYIHHHNADFNDVKQRMLSARQLSETLILGGHRHATQSNLLNADNTLEKPMLGRYQIEQALGKGAMGTVYLGVDPKIGRKVAIKTLALSQEFAASELDAVKARFFREAETAGQLNHPNIVTIYDAGEEHDLAYIAMELLQGHDLNPHIKQPHLLPLPTVLNIMIKVAEALHYAHLQHVIHRDIKPANIMYEPDTQAVKVTDFGIARITDHSKTKTGMVLGTPNFMSPEQLSGKALDGRSDLFSLGATLYQLVTGQLPFDGDSMANLMFNISHQVQTDILVINPQLPAQLSSIINHLLEKDANLRYADGAALAQDLRACLDTLTA